VNARQAFLQLVVAVANNDWSPALPDIPMVDVDGEFRTPREVCQLASGLPDKLEDEVVGVLLGEMRDQKLCETLGKDRSYGPAGERLRRRRSER
jgi:hypothetical protein